MKYEKKVSILNSNFTGYVRLIERSLLQLENKAVKISKSSITVINFNRNIFYWMDVRTKRMDESMETAQALCETAKNMLELWLKKNYTNLEY